MLIVTDMVTATSVKQYDHVSTTIQGFQNMEVIYITSNNKHWKNTQVSFKGNVQEIIQYRAIFPSLSGNNT